MITDEISGRSLSRRLSRSIIEATVTSWLSVQPVLLGLLHVDLRDLAVELVEHHLDDLPRRGARPDPVGLGEQVALERALVRLRKIGMRRRELRGPVLGEGEELLLGDARLLGESRSAIWSITKPSGMVTVT